MIIKRIPICDIDCNKGQIDGLPANPRTITKNDFDRLKKSISEDPEFLEAKPLMVYEHSGRYVAVSGNQRLEACKALSKTKEFSTKLSAIPCVIIPKETDILKIRKLSILDNTHYGDFNFEMLANDGWGDLELIEWGVDLPTFDFANEGVSVSDDNEDPNLEERKKCPHCGEEI